MSEFCSESNAKALVEDLASNHKQAAAKKFFDCLGDPQNKDKDSFFLIIARAQHPKSPDAPYIDFR